MRRSLRSGGTQLTQSQIDVLTRVAQFKSSKQIARELGISHHTVDQRIRAAIEKMGVQSRADAARAFIESRDKNDLVNEGICGTLAYQLPDIDVSPFLADQKPSTGEWNPAGGRQKQQLKETQAMYFAGDSQVQSRLSLDSVLTKTGRENDLTALGRTICIMLTMLLTLLVVGALVGLAEGLSRLV
jgi:DNA-binding CsgD family transcriptional regulator